MNQVDITAIKFGQGLTAGMLAVAFLSDLWPVAAAVGAINLISALAPRLNPTVWLYRQLGPALDLRPRLIEDEMRPHIFARGFSGAVTLAGAATVWVGMPVLGWALTLMVAALAILNITVGFCAGCFTYYQLQRVGLVGR